MSNFLLNRLFHSQQALRYWSICCDRHICGFSLLSMQHQALVLVTLRLIKHVAQLLIVRAHNPSSRKGLCAMDFVFESPACLTPQSLHVFLLLVIAQPGGYLPFSLFWLTGSDRADWLLGRRNLNSQSSANRWITQFIAAQRCHGLFYRAKVRILYTCIVAWRSQISHGVRTGVTSSRPLGILAW